MQSWSDAHLLDEYAGRGSEAAFGEIVRRYANLVYSAALRQTGGAEEARDVAQMLFADLARKAGSIGGNVVLAGWLYRGARLRSLELRRNDQRRHWRERQAMNSLDSGSEAEGDWSVLRPVLDEVMSNLGGEDRDALLLRFFKNESLAAVGMALSISEDAAQKRVSRALGKLRELLAQRGLGTSAAALAGSLAANATESAPGGLAAAWASSALAGASPITSNLFPFANMKTALAFAALAGGLAIVSVAHVRLQRERNALQSELQTQTKDFAALRAEIDQLKAHPAVAVDDDAAHELARARAKIQRLQFDLKSRESRANEFARRLAAAGQPTNIEPPQVTIESTFLCTSSSRFTLLNGTFDELRAEALKSSFISNLNCDVLSAPRITTRCGTEATISTVESIPFGGGTTNVGISLDVLPQCSDSSGPIDLAIGIQVTGVNSNGEYKALNTNATYSISDSGSAVVTILEPANWGGATPFSGTSNAMVVFISPTLIDAAGNRLHPPTTNGVTTFFNPSGFFPGEVGAATPSAKADEQ